MLGSLSQRSVPSDRRSSPSVYKLTANSDRGFAQSVRSENEKGPPENGLDYNEREPRFARSLPMLDGLFSGFFRSNANGIFNGTDKHFAITNFSSLS